MGLHGCSRLDRKARSQRIQVGIGIDLSAINVEFFAPDQLLLLALFHNRVEEAAKDVDAIAFTNARQTGMIGQRLVQIIAKIPTHAQPICRMAHELPFGAYSLKKHDELQFEEHDRINGRTPFAGIGLLNKLPDERQIECARQMPIKMVRWY